MVWFCNHGEKVRTYTLVLLTISLKAVSKSVIFWLKTNDNKVVGWLTFKRRMKLGFAWGGSLCYQLSHIYTAFFFLQRGGTPFQKQDTWVANILSNRTVDVSNESTWKSNGLKLTCINMFMAIIHKALVLSGSENWLDSSIDKAEAIVQCGSLYWDCMRIYLKLWQLQKRLVPL